jgi:hypothetical protein
MTDHLLIGILIGIVSGTVALIVIAVVTLRRFELAREVEPLRLHRALAELQSTTERTERTLHDDIEAARRELETVARDSRDESSAVARALRDEIAGGLKDVSDAFARGLGDLRSLQQRQSEALAGRLAELTDAAVAALRDHPLPALARMAEAEAQGRRRPARVLAEELGTVEAPQGAGP